MSFGKVIFGDNQFLGVNHSSQSKAAVMMQKFHDAESIIEVLGYAYECGVRDFMFTTHEKYAPVFSEIVRSKLFPDMNFIPCLPYAHKYANAMAERGIVEVVLSTIKDVKKIDLLKSLAVLPFGDFSGVMKLLVEVEMLMCKGLAVKGVFLQNILFDLLLAFSAKEIIIKYDRYVSGDLGLIPGYITMNHGAASRFLCREAGLVQPWVCSNLNANGFRTNPSLEDVKSSFAKGNTKNIAMSVFASGLLSADESLSFVVQSKGVDSILFGSSSRENIRKNVSMII